MERIFNYNIGKYYFKVTNYLKLVTLWRNLKLFEYRDKHSCPFELHFYLTLLSLIIFTWYFVSVLQKKEEMIVSLSH